MLRGLRCLAVLAIATVLGAPPAAAQDTARYQNPTVARLGSLSKASDTSALIISYARAVDSSFDTTPGAGDQQRLMLGTCPSRCRYGPLARIEPRRYHEHWSGEVPPDSGEVIARIISEGPYLHISGKDTTYKFNIQGRDTVYWWVGLRAGRPVSVFTSTRPGARPLVSDLTIEDHGSGFWKQGLARWIWKDTDETGWGTCDGRRCCGSTGLSLPVSR